jgi:hypothetical protein
MQDSQDQYTFRAPLVNAFNSVVTVITTKTKQLFLGAVLGGLIGLGYAALKPITYQSNISFFVEDSKSSSSSLMSMVAGQFGLDLGSLTGGNGVLAGDNVLELAKSKLLLQRALQTPYPLAGKDSTYSLADHYIATMGWNKKWESSSKVGFAVSFATTKNKFTRVEDSLFGIVLKRIVEKELSISKPDKKLGFYSIDIETRDELLSKLLAQRLLSTTTNFYIEGKTGRLRKNLDRLQHRVDSLGVVVNARTLATAQAAVTNQIDINPALASGISASTEIKSKDKTFANIVYGELLKNLEVAKTALIQETPSIVVVDELKLPKRNKLDWYLGLLVGFFAGGFASLLFYFKLKR